MNAWRGEVSSFVDHMNSYHQKIKFTTERSKDSKEKPLVAFKRTPNVKDSLVRAKLPKFQTEGLKGCFRCGKSHCQVRSFMLESNSCRKVAFLVESIL